MRDSYNYIQLHISFDDAGRELEVLDVTQMEDDIYRIEENPVFTEKVNFGDLIKVRAKDDYFLYIETIKKSKYNRYNWLLSKEVIESTELKTFIQKIREWRGKSEQVFGGIFIVNLPVHSNVDIQHELQKVINAVQK